MKYSTDTLSAYLTGECDETLAREIAQAEHTDSDVKQTLAELRAQDSRVASAFDSLLDNPLPATVRDAVPYDSPGAPGEQTVGLRRRNRNWIAAAASLLLLVCGALVGQALMPSQSNESATLWYHQVAEYQALYGRPTLQIPTPSDAQKSATQEKLRALSGIDVTIPTLENFELEFKRGQYLESNGEALIQLAYLPASGRPYALCFLQESGADRSPTSGHHAGMNLTHWRRDGIAYVLVADAPEPTLQAISSHLFAL